MEDFKQHIIRFECDGLFVEHICPQEPWHHFTFFWESLDCCLRWYIESDLAKNPSFNTHKLKFLKRHKGNKGHSGSLVVSIRVYLD